MSTKNIAVAFSFVTLLFACAGNPNFLTAPDGAVRPVELSEPFSACHDWEAVERNAPVYPKKMMEFLVIAQKTERIARFSMTYNILEDGSVGNILLGSPAWLMDHAAYSSAPEAASEAMLDWRYRYIGDPPIRPSRRCESHFTFEIQTG